MAPMFLFKSSETPPAARSISSAFRDSALHCRVFSLVSKDKSERVKVTISCEYFFPLRAEWFRKKESEPIRKLEAAAFKKNKDYWFVSKLILSGKDWTTTIRFPDVNAGPFKDKLPQGLFID